jgi:Ca2+-transporting ATPase
MAAMSGNVWQTDDHYQLVVKGAPEKIIKHSLSGDDVGMAAAEKALHHLTGLGYRVIALAEIPAIQKIPDSFDDIALDDMHFIGLLAVADELRPEAARAINTAQAAGITVRMITGDHAETAYAIGKKLGLVTRRDQVMDCRTIDSLGDKELVQKVTDITVFARVIPEAKHRILTILKTSHITAMTGDGVNDVPALTNAHVGVAMGSGSQIAKEAGDIVLLDDNFASIVKAVEGGRVINDNIRRMLFYLLATSLGGVTIMIGALVAGMPLPIVAVQVLWINLVTDTVFAIPIGVEPAEDRVMQRPPRRADQPILDGALLQRLFIVAATMAAIGLATFWYFLQSHSIDYARTIAFTTLVVMQWANAVNARSEFASLANRIRVPNIAFSVGFVVAIILQLLALFGPLAGPLYVVPVDLIDIIVAPLIGFALIILVSELHKWYSRRGRQNRSER